MKLNTHHDPCMVQAAEAEFCLTCLIMSKDARVRKPAVLRIDGYAVLQNQLAVGMLDVRHYVESPSEK